MAENLKQIAGEMINVCVEGLAVNDDLVRVVQRKLSRGLGLSLSAYPGPVRKWRLVLSRKGMVGPSPAEVRIVREAFAVPDYAKGRGGVVDIVNGNVSSHHTIELEWIEAKQGRLF
jgi:hypothetical protein